VFILFRYLIDRPVFTRFLSPGYDFSLEMHDAYKDVDDVVEAVEQADLAVMASRLGT